MRLWLGNWLAKNNTQRIHRLSVAQQGVSSTQRAIRRDHVICLMWICKFLFDRDSSRRHRRLGSKPQKRSRLPWYKGADRRDTCEFHDGIDCGPIAVRQSSLQSQRVPRRMHLNMDSRRARMLSMRSDLNSSLDGKVAEWFKAHAWNACKV